MSPDTALLAPPVKACIEGAVRGHREGAAPAAPSGWPRLVRRCTRRRLVDRAARSPESRNDQFRLRPRNDVGHAATRRRLCGDRPGGFAPFAIALASAADVRSRRSGRAAAQDVDGHGRRDRAGVHVRPRPCRRSWRFASTRPSATPAKRSAATSRCSDTRPDSFRTARGRAGIIEAAGAVSDASSFAIERGVECAVPGQRAGA